jgi:hypothetical protein
VHGVVIKPASKKTKNLLFKELQKGKLPGPGKYHADDRVLKSKQPEFTFARQHRRNRTPPPDKRRFIDVNLDAIKKRIKVAMILPEHPPKREILDEKIKVGPGSYQVDHKHTEPRQDAGTIKIVQAKEKKEVLDDKPPLEPNFDYDKPEKGVPLYKDPVDHRPQHVPEKYLNIEKWKYYDVNLDAIREIQQPHDFAQNLDRKEFLDKAEYLQDLEELKARHEKAPDIYTYSPKEKDTKLLFDFGLREGRYKYEDKDLLDEFDQAGDVLILDGDKPRKRIPGFEYAKMKDRFPDDLLADDNYQDKQLILDPSDKLTKKRAFTLVNIDKDKGRESKPVDEDDILNNYINYEGIMPYDPSDPNPKVPDFGKQMPRFKKEGLIDDETKEELILNPSQPKINHGSSTFGKAELRFKPPKVKDDPWHEEQPITEIIKNVDNFDNEIKENKEGHFFNR